jgi:hypothetical protein
MKVGQLLGNQVFSLQQHVVELCEKGGLRPAFFLYAAVLASGAIGNEVLARAFLLSI